MGVTYPIHIHAPLGVDVALLGEHGGHVALKGGRVGAGLLRAKVQHVAGAGPGVALADGMQERYEVLAHARSQLLCQPKVQQDLHSDSINVTPIALRFSSNDISRPAAQPCNGCLIEQVPKSLQLPALYETKPKCCRTITIIAK